MTTLDVLSIGHAAYDITMGVDHHPGADEKMQADAMGCAGGGPAANAAVAVRRLGGSSGFCGYLGRDVYGEAHAGELNEAGVDPRWLVRGAHPTPVSAILAKPDGSRSVINYKGDTPWLESDVLNTLPAIAAKVLLFDGHEPLISAAIVNQARARGIPTVLDAGSVHRGTKELAPVVDYLVGSERFALAWAGSDDIEQALAALARIAPNVVITLGAAGLLWARGDETGRLPAFHVDAVDSTGAGDAFHGAFAYGLARGLVWPELLRYAAAVGALACTKLGARAGLPDRDAVHAFLAARAPATFM
jgi:sulfofructose kinase